MTKKRAIISVSDKTGVVSFAGRLRDAGYEIISTGGTAKALEENGIHTVNVSDITGFPECLDGRVKTLHPNIHAGVLARRSEPSHMSRLEELGIQAIDIVVVNLYPFKAAISKKDVTLEEAVENIDIGGPTILRAAAKNWQDVAALIDPADYDTVIREIEDGGVTTRTKFMLAGKVFEHTAAYDAMIADYLRKQRGDERIPETITLTYEKAGDMRYGENPHQNAGFYREIHFGSNTLPAARQLHGKPLSYNNINDANGALDVLKEFGFARPCAVAVKHANPCGVGCGDSIYEAYCNAYDSDPVSIYGGIVALNREVDAKTAEKLNEIFLEIILAPSYSTHALEILTVKKNIRLLELEDLAAPNTPDMLDLKKVAGGLLVQKLDVETFGTEPLKVVTKRAPTPEEMEQLQFAWKVVKHIKSNAIVLVKGNGTVGVGPGQTNRITALELAVKYAGEKTAGSVMGSDAYFPFPDCVELAAEKGITAIIQPGGSIRDEQSIKACDDAGIAMVFTGIRHFKH